jgi:hypothetical protein
MTAFKHTIDTTAGADVGRAPVRAGLLACPRLPALGSQRLRRSRAGPEDLFCGAVRNDLRVPLTPEGRPRTMRGAPQPRAAAKPPPHPRSQAAQPAGGHAAVIFSCRCARAATVSSDGRSRLRSRGARRAQLAAASRATACRWEAERRQPPRRVPQAQRSGEAADPAATRPPPSQPRNVRHQPVASRCALCATPRRHHVPPSGSLHAAGAPPGAPLKP